jgi:hypothetical protein
MVVLGLVLLACSFALFLMALVFVYAPRWVDTMAILKMVLSFFVFSGSPSPDCDKVGGLL